MSDVKRRKVGHGAQKKRHVPESSPPAAPSPGSEQEPSDDEQESATVDGTGTEEQPAKPKTFKDLVREIQFLPDAN